MGVMGGMVMQGGVREGGEMGEMRVMGETGLMGVMGEGGGTASTPMG